MPATSIVVSMRVVLAVVCVRCGVEDNVGVNRTGAVAVNTARVVKTADVVGTLAEVAVAVALALALALVNTLALVVGAADTVLSLVLIVAANVLIGTESDEVEAAIDVVVGSLLKTTYRRACFELVSTLSSVLPALVEDNRQILSEARKENDWHTFRAQQRRLHRSRLPTNKADPMRSFVKPFPHLENEHTAWAAVLEVVNDGAVERALGFVVVRVRTLAVWLWLDGGVVSDVVGGCGPDRDAAVVPTVVLTVVMNPPLSLISSSSSSS